jgi:DNA modification methylase
LILIVIDPPYNIGKDKRWDKWKSVDDYVNWMTDVFKECERVLKPNGSFYWWHNDMTQVWRLIQSIESETNFVYKQFIVWNKRFDGASNKGFLDGFVEVGGLRNYQQMSEYCLFYTLQDEYGSNKSGFGFEKLRQYFKEMHESIGLNKKTIIETVGQRADHCFRYNSSQWDMPTKETYEEISKLPRMGDFEFISYEDLRSLYESSKYTYNNLKTDHSVWNYEIASKQGHITPKPVEMIGNIVRHSSNEGDVVLDCFMGSGTTAVAAARLNRNFIGFERESDYVRIANQRLESVQDEISERRLTE